MRLRLLSTALLAVLCFAACKKESSNNNTPANNNYIINGVQNVNLKADSFAIIGLTVEYKQGTQGPVDLSVSGLPTGVTAEFNPTASGTPSFGTALTFDADSRVAGGTFPIKLNATSATMGNKSYDMNLVIEEGPCWNRLVGTYSGTILNINAGTTVNTSSTLR